MAEIDPILVNDWYVVAKAKDIQPGDVKPFRLLEQDIVIWRGSSPGSPALAWQDLCPHRGVALSRGKIVDQNLACGYHGWQYDKTGQCTKVPSLSIQPSSSIACVKTYKCQESKGYIWVCLGDPVQDLPSFPEWDNPDYRLFLCNPYYTKTSPFRVMENNFDQFHIAFLHDGSLGDSRYPNTENYKVTTEKDSITIHTINNWHLGGAYNGDKTLNRIAISMKIDRPLSFKAIKEIKKYSAIAYWFINVTPIDEESCLLWCAVAMNYGHEIEESEMQKNADEVFLEDVSMLESHRPALLPLLPRNRTDTQWQPEVHVPSDKASIAYRRWLKELGITFGVC